MSIWQTKEYMTNDGHIIITQMPSRCWRLMIDGKNIYDATWEFVSFESAINEAAYRMTDAYKQLQEKIKELKSILNVSEENDNAAN